MHVWVVAKGEYGQGKSAIGVFSTSEKAILVALAEKPHFEGGWTPDVANLVDEDYKSWENGCDIVTVEKFTVDEIKEGE